MKNPIDSSTPLLRTFPYYFSWTSSIHSLLFLLLVPTISKISDVMCKSKPITCQLDSLPTVLVKSCLPSLVAFISAIIYSSLTTSTVPTPLKRTMKSLCPISNLPFICKILKKAVASQLLSHVSHKNLYEQFQSSSVLPNIETALIKSPTTSSWLLILNQQ